MKTFVAAVCATIFVIPVVLAGQSMDALLQDFSRPLAGDGVSYTVIHLNDKTVEALFAQSPSKLAMRVQARQNTMFYVQGTVEEDTEISIGFSVEQGGETIEGKALSMSNFEDGRELKPGDRLDGVVALGRKLNLSEPFTVENDGESVLFDFPDDVVQEIAN